MAAGNRFVADHTGEGAFAHCPRSAAVSKTSRSRFAKPAGWNTPDAAELFNVLRLVLCTQPRSNLTGAAAGNCTRMSGDHAQSCQSTAMEYSRPGWDFRIRHINIQGNGLLICTCLLQLQMRLVFPPNASWIHKSYEPGLLVGLDEL